MEMKKGIKILAAVLAAAGLTACSPGNGAGSEIKAPIYGSDEKNNFKTAEVKLMDLEEGENAAAALGYACSDALSVAHGGNLISLEAEKFQELKAGDIIAVVDSSELDYDLRRQSIMTDSAYEIYLSEGTETARLNYEYEKALLDEIQYKVDSYTLKAPYDCVITDISRITVGSEIEEGAYICSVAPVGDIFAYIGVDPKNDIPFKLGTKVNVTLTGKAYEATVISVPDSNSYRFELQYASQAVPAINSQDFYVKSDMIFADPYGGPTSADSKRNVIIGFEPDVLAELLEETPNAVKAGWATVNVITRKRCNVLAVPSNAVIQRENAYVVLYKDGQRLQTPVTVGETINGYTIIVDGVREGEVVVIQ